ncbi:T9SS type A sorting domain-containing protein [Brumimicrobium mesophilum]|uniref:T9SS type A sorting domain-containing protein n=1 Tax=Brumimicrobium mesophilum TaxID=392717 RepID=UPI000D143592|nr:T9SS type A sorting domain-containing protein [Brumimicrobium mesophilum]
MKQFIVTLFAVMMIGFGVKSQNYIYTVSATGTAGTLVTTITTTGLVKTPNGGGCVLNMIYNTEVKFFNHSGVELSLGDPGVPPIYTLQGTFRCNTPPNSALKTSFFQIPNNLGTTTNNLSSTFSIDDLASCASLTLDNVNCHTIRFQIHFPGFNNTNYNVNGTSTLPIELITFDAYKKDRSVELAWKTASELNNDYFTIERSVEGKSWEFLKTVKGAGNSSEISEYTVIDDSPYAGVSYYRLKQTDYDGTTETFNIVSVEQNDVKELQAYPNPVLNRVTILGVNSDKELRVFNTVGVEITGNIVITNSPSKKTFIDMSQLPKGMYFIVNGDESLKVLKQ